jgi:dynein heavy chain
MRMLFEVQDLKVASPATVSRCGMVYLMYEDIGWKPFVKSWITLTYAERYDTIKKKVFLHDDPDNEEN